MQQYIGGLGQDKLESCQMSTQWPLDKIHSLPLEEVNYKDYKGKKSEEVLLLGAHWKLFH